MRGHMNVKKNPLLRVRGALFMGMTSLCSASLTQKQNYFYNYTAALLLKEEEININSDTNVHTKKVRDKF